MWNALTCVDKFLNEAVRNDKITPAKFLLMLEFFLWGRTLQPNYSELPEVPVNEENIHFYNIQNMQVNASVHQNQVQVQNQQSSIQINR